MAGDHIQLKGKVLETLRDKFRVQTENGEILAQLSGKMRQNRIQILLGDLVTVQVSPYDMSHGMITYRHIEGKS